LNDLRRDACSTLLPAFADLRLEEDVLRFLEGGGCSILLGESREEYLGRGMSPARRATETADAFVQVAELARERAGCEVLVAVDQELGGIQRLHRLAPALPSAAEAAQLPPEEITSRSRATAEAARRLGVNLFLAPIVDVVVGANPWLSGRHLGPDPEVVRRVVRAYVRGVQAAGVAATAKHFPGHPVTELDPALHEAVVGGTKNELARSLSVFRDVVADGVRAVMTGPALVPALDPVEPASTSPRTVAHLRETLGFQGLVISDDLDAPGILRGRPIAEVAVASLAAGADLLLVSAGSGLDRLADAIARAVSEGRLSRERLASAAGRVRRLAEMAAA
jgi:beta-N-acetylhexosaminidase